MNSCADPDQGQRYDGVRLVHRVVQAEDFQVSRPVVKPCLQQMTLCQNLLRKLEEQNKDIGSVDLEKVIKTNQEGIQDGQRGGHF